MKKLTKKEIVILTVCLLFIFAFIGILAGGLIENSNSEKKALEKTYGIGEIQICDDFEVTITDYEVLDKIYSTGGEYAKGNYLVVYYKIKNITNSSKILYDNNFKVTNSYGNIYEPVYIYQKNIKGYYLDGIIDIPSGVEHEIKIYFDIAETEELKFLFGEWGIFNSKIYTFYNNKQLDK